MANQKIIEKKQAVVEEIKNTVEENSSVVLFEYQGLTVADMTSLRRKLRENDSDAKIYKNTLAKRAFDSMNIDLGDELNGPKAIAFGKDAVAPIKVLSDFAKEHEALKLKVGIVDGEIADNDMLKQLAAIPSREGLLGMIAGGLIEHVRNIAICIDLHAKNLEEYE